MTAEKDQLVEEARAILAGLAAKVSGDDGIRMVMRLHQLDQLDESGEVGRLIDASGQERSKPVGAESERSGLLDMWSGFPDHDPRFPIIKP